MWQKDFRRLELPDKRQSKILEISSKIDGSRIQIQMIDNKGGHYGVFLETQRKKNVLYPEDALGEL